MNLRKITVIAVFLLIAVISFTRLSPWASDPENHSYSIVKTDDKISTVMALSGGAAATSATLSLLPGDFGTPIAEQMAELAKYFLMILSALYLEKFLITISGFITFSVLIPIACILVCVAVVIKRRDLIEIAVKIAIVGFIIFLIVPASVMMSDMVYDTQAQTVESTLSQYNELEREPHYRTNGASFSWIREAINVSKKILKNAHLIEIPVILMQASEDTLVVPDAQERFCQLNKNCKLIRFEGSKHEIFNATDEIIKDYYSKIFDYYEN